MNVEKIFFVTSMITLIGSIALPNAKASDQIIEAQGNVSIKRNGDSQYRSVSVGAILRNGDLIRPNPGAKVKIRCTNNTLWRVLAGVPSGLGVGCPDSVALRYNGRGRGGCDFLAFLNNRCLYTTQVLAASPDLRWNPVAGVTRYQVQVVNGNEVIWQQMAEATATHYGGTELQPNVNYQLLVTTVDRPDHQRTFRLTLQRLDETKTAVLQMAIAQIDSPELSPEARAIALASIYQEVEQSATASSQVSNPSGLVWEAIATLEPLVFSGNSTPYVHRLLGDLYLEVGLLELATPRYRSAINLAQEASDCQNQASAAVGLANIAAAQGDRRAAGRWLRQAREGYALLGDTRQVELVDQWLHKLEAP